MGAAGCYGVRQSRAPTPASEGAQAPEANRDVITQDELTASALQSQSVLEVVKALTAVPDSCEDFTHPR